MKHDRKYWLEYVFYMIVTGFVLSAIEGVVLGVEFLRMNGIMMAVVNYVVMQMLWWVEEWVKHFRGEWRK